MAHQLTTDYAQDSLSLFRMYKRLTERSMAQAGDECLSTTLDEEMNSIAQIVKHMAGNMRSRWTDFLTTDGEKPDRDRDREFTDPPASREAMMKLWEEGWAALFAALEQLGPDDMDKTVKIRGEAHSVMQAINRQVGHYSYHCGQIILLAKHFAGARWEAVTIPRNKSEEFSRKVGAAELSQR